MSSFLAPFLLCLTQPASSFVFSVVSVFLVSFPFSPRFSSSVGVMRLFARITPISFVNYSTYRFTLDVFVGVVEVAILLLCHPGNPPEKSALNSGKTRMLRLHQSVITFE